VIGVSGAAAFRASARQAARGARRHGVILTVAVVALAIAGLFGAVGRGSVPDLPTAEVTRGEFVDTLELRGEIRPLRSVVLTSPMQSGELQIVKLARNGGPVKAGDVVVEFDATTLKRTIQEKQSELKQATAEIEQARAQARITDEQNATALLKAQYDIERARLDLNRGDTVSRVDAENARLSHADAVQRLKELEQKIASDRIGAEADLAAKLRKREKAQFDLRRAEEGLGRLQLKAPTDGIVNVLPNYQAGSMFGNAPEFRQGDRAWAGANILELPDLSAVFLQARLDETDRSRLQPGQEAVVRIEAVPGREFKATINAISLLARVDYMGTWPPPRNFDLDLKLLEVDPRIRPGMTAVARIATERVPNVVLVPAEAVFQQNGSPIVYRLDGSTFEARAVRLARRGKEQAIVASGIEPGDRIATRRPSAAMIEGGR
jgi:RND family efflux transporter MFP subunit